MQNTLVLPDIPFRQRTDSPFLSIQRDPRSLNFIVEELVAHAIARVLIPSSSPAAEFVSSLPQPLATRVKVVRDEKAQVAVRGLLDPIGSEVGARLVHPTLAVVEHRGDVAGEAYAHLVQHLDKFILALEQKAQIDLDLLPMVAACKVLRRSSKDPANRLAVANLEAVFQSYRPTAVPALQLRSTLSQEQARELVRVLEDKRFLYLSFVAHRIGYPAHLKRALVLLARRLQDLLAESRFSALFNIGSRAIGAATGMPLVESGDLAALLSASYLPPIVSIRAHVSAAMAACLEAHPAFPPKTGDA